MEFERLKPAVESLRMPEDAKHRIATALAAETDAPQPHMTWRRPALALAVLVLLLGLAMPVFASVEPIYRLMYLVSPAVAQFFRPVQESCEDQSIRMEVVSVFIQDDTAQIYLTIQDLTGEHTDGPVDLNDSYAIRLRRRLQPGGLRRSQPHLHVSGHSFRDERKRPYRE